MPNIFDSKLQHFIKRVKAHYDGFFGNNSFNFFRVNQAFFYKIEMHLKNLTKIDE